MAMQGLPTKRIGRIGDYTQRQIAHKFNQPPSSSFLPRDAL